MDGQHLRYIRKYCLRHTQAGLAARLGLSVRALQQYEAGERADGTEVEIPKYIELAVAALVLGISDFRGKSATPYCLFVIQLGDLWHVVGVASGADDAGPYATMTEATQAAARIVAGHFAYETAVAIDNNMRVSPIVITGSSAGYPMAEYPDGQGLMPPPPTSRRPRKS